MMRTHRTRALLLAITAALLGAVAPAGARTHAPHYYKHCVLAPLTPYSATQATPSRVRLCPQIPY